MAGSKINAAVVADDLDRRRIFLGKLVRDGATGGRESPAAGDTFVLSVFLTDNFVRLR